MTAKDVCESGEMWWVKNACARTRDRIAKMIADALNLVVQTSLDTFACNTGHKTELAVPTTETLYNSIEYIRSTNEVVLYNNCCNPLRCRNGILCNMHPSEG
jgi:ribosomal protein L16 Arg81 hydroxylase